MPRSHECFPGYRIAITFVSSVFAQLVISLLMIRGGFWVVLFSIPVLLLYLLIVGRAFLVAMRRASLLDSKLLRFGAPIFCSVILVISSFALGAYLATVLNEHLFHIPVEQFDRSKRAKDKPCQRNRAQLK